MHHPDDVRVPGAPLANLAPIQCITTACSPVSPSPEHKVLKGRHMSSLLLSLWHLAPCLALKILIQSINEWGFESGLDSKTHALSDLPRCSRDYLLVWTKWVQTPSQASL